jgi:hypothetical protein
MAYTTGLPAPRLPTSKMENLMLYILMAPEELKAPVESRDILAEHELHAENRIFISLPEQVALGVV